MSYSISFRLFLSYHLRYWPWRQQNNKNQELTCSWKVSTLAVKTVYRLRKISLTGRHNLKHNLKLSLLPEGWDLVQHYWILTSVLTPRNQNGKQKKKNRSYLYFGEFKLEEVGAAGSHKHRREQLGVWLHLHDQANTRRVIEKRSEGARLAKSGLTAPNFAPELRGMRACVRACARVTIEKRRRAGWVSSRGWERAVTESVRRFRLLKRKI